MVNGGGRVVVHGAMFEAPGSPGGPRWPSAVRCDAGSLTAYAMRVSGAYADGVAGNASAPPEVLGAWTSGKVFTPSEDAPALVEGGVLAIPDAPGEGEGAELPPPETWRAVPIMENSVMQSAAAQAALDAGDPVVYFAPGAASYDVQTLIVPAHVTHIFALGHEVQADLLTLEVAAASSVPLVVDGFGVSTKVSHEAERPVVVRHGSYQYLSPESIAAPVVLLDAEISEDSYFANKAFFHATSLHLTANSPQLLMSNTDLAIAGFLSTSSEQVLSAAQGSMSVLGGRIAPTETIPTEFMSAAISADGVTGAVHGDFAPQTPAHLPPSVLSTQVPGLGRAELASSELGTAGVCQVVLP